MLLPVTALIQFPTIRELSAAVRITGDTTVPAIVKVQSGELAPSVMCFPGAGESSGTVLGHGLSLAALARHLGNGYPVSVVTTGRVPENPIPSTLIEIVAAQCRPRYGPFNLMDLICSRVIRLEGWSPWKSRGLLGDGEQVPLLALLDVYGPGYPKPVPARERVARHLHEMATMTWRARAKYVAVKIRGKIERSRHASLPNHAHAFGGERVSVIAAAIGHTSQTSGDTRQDHASSRTELPSSRAEDCELTMGWSAVAAGGVDVRLVPGSHLTMLSEPHIRELADELRSIIREAIANASTARHE